MLKKTTSTSITIINASSSGRRQSSHFPHLIPHRNSLVFRIRVPAAIQECLGRKEYRRSLGPSYIRDAKIKSLKIAAAAHEIFALARAVMVARTVTAVKLNAMYTINDADSEEAPVSQENLLPDGVYTNLMGRTLDSLTDGEIRSMAEDWLLSALKGENAFMTMMAKRRQEQEHKILDIYLDTYGIMMIMIRIKPKANLIHYLQPFIHPFIQPFQSVTSKASPPL